MSTLDDTLRVSTLAACVRILRMRLAGRGEWALARLCEFALKEVARSGYRWVRRKLRRSFSPSPFPESMISHFSRLPAFGNNSHQEAPGLSLRGASSWSSALRTRVRSSPSLRHLDRRFC